MGNKIGLGTVQFGLDYGISNREGKTPEAEAGKILAAAARNGIRVLDTAPLYGASEEALGKVLPDNHPFGIVTKTPRFQKGTITFSDARVLEETFYRSLERLRQPSVYGLLVHDADNLLVENGHLLLEKMKGLKKRGLVKKVGVSVYSGRQIDGIMEKHGIDLVQLPINILDQRLLLSGHLSKLKGAGVEIHARSVFLQGLLLMDPDKLSPFFNKIRGHLKMYHQAIRQEGISPVRAALGFVAGLDEVDVVLCGVNNSRQLKDIVRHLKDPVKSDMFSGFAIEDATILNPSMWQA